VKDSDSAKWGALFAEAHRAVDVLSATRLRRIEEIRAALEAGIYRVDGRLEQALQELAIPHFDAPPETPELP